MPNTDGSITNNDAPEVIDFLDTESVKKAIGSLTAQKNHFREKVLDPTTGKTYKELYEIASKPKETPAPLPTDSKPDAPKPAVPDFDKLMDIASATRSLSDDEINELRSEATSLGADPVKYIKSKAGQAHLKEFRSTNKATDSTPSPSSRIPVFNGKPANQTLTDEKASATDKQKAFETLIKGRRNGSE